MLIRSHRFQVYALSTISLLASLLVTRHMAYGAAAEPAIVDVAAAPDVATTPVPVASTPAAAPTLQVPPDPLDDPSGAVDAARSAWRDGGWLGVALVVFYLGVLVAKRWVSWLQTGRRAVVVASVLTALVTAIATFSGGTPTLSWAANALIAGVLLYLRPEPKEVS